MVKKKEKREWVVYPEIELTIDDFAEYLKNKNSNKMEEKNEVEAMPVDEITAEINAEVAAETEAEGISAEELLNLAETMDLTDEQKREIFIEQLKESKVHFRNTIHVGNKTITKFSPAYKKVRQRKNKEQRASRKANR